MLFFVSKNRELTFVKKNVGSLLFFVVFAKYDKKFTSAIPAGNIC